VEVLRYLASLTRPFFLWWWAAITGVATLLSFFEWRSAGMHLSGTAVAIVVGTFFTVVFFAASVIVQGLGWYTQSHRQPVIVKCTAADRESSVEIFQLTSVLPLEPGQVISLLRTLDDRVFCIGMLKVERVASNRYQCVPLWIAPGSRQDLKQGRLPLTHLSASLLLNEKDLSLFKEKAPP
jgi:hypothetical protein